VPPEPDSDVPASNRADPPAPVVDDPDEIVTSPPSILFPEDEPAATIACPPSDVSDRSADIDNDPPEPVARDMSPPTPSKVLEGVVVCRKIDPLILSSFDVLKMTSPLEKSPSPAPDDTKTDPPFAPLPLPPITFIDPPNVLPDPDDNDISPPGPSNDEPDDTFTEPPGARFLLLSNI